MVVRDILVDCDADTLLVKVDPAGPACHTGEQSCFYRLWQSDSAANGHRAQAKTCSSARPTAPATGEASIVEELYDVILERQERRPRGSYTAGLLSAGEDAIL